MISSVLDWARVDLEAAVDYQVFLPMVDGEELPGPIEVKIRDGNLDRHSRYI